MQHQPLQPKPACTLIPDSVTGLARLNFDPAEVSPPEAEERARQLGRAIHAVRHWAGLDFARPFDVVLDARQLVPVAYPELERPCIILPAATLQPRLDGELGPEEVHELAHLLLFAHGAPFLSEGWSVACTYQLSASAYFPMPLRDDVPSLHHAVSEHPEGLRPLEVELHPHGSWGDLRVQEVPNERNRLAYARAGSFVLHLLEVHGVRPFTLLLRALADDPALREEVAFERVYRRPMAEAETEWRTRLLQLPLAHPGRDRAGLEKGTDPFQGTEPADWTLYTGGSASAAFTWKREELHVTGRMGTGAAFPIIALQKFLRKAHTPSNWSGHAGLRFEARGDGKTYQAGLMTLRARQPGKEFMYLLETHPEWRLHEVPFHRFHRFVSGRAGWTGMDVLALRFSAIGYRGQDIRFDIRKLELFR